jgi:Na+-transporting NADH:ubiquinone oxidoreductase subunit NqrB
MDALVGLLRGALGFVVGMTVGMVVLAIGRHIAFGDGLGPTPGGLPLTAQIGVAVAWFLGAAVAVWTALGISHRRLAGLLVAAWLFQMVWLSPEVRPVMFEMRAITSVLVAIGGFGMYVMWRMRHVPA